MRQSNLMRAITGVAFAFFLFGSLLDAQVPTAGNVFFGYSYYHRSASSNLNSESFNGWEGSLEGKVFPYVGIVADLTRFVPLRRVSRPNTCGLTFLRRASGQCPGIDRHRFPFLMKD